MEAKIQQNEEFTKEQTQSQIEKEEECCDNSTNMVDKLKESVVVEQQEQQQQEQQQKGEENNVEKVDATTANQVQQMALKAAVLNQAPLMAEATNVEPFLSSSIQSMNSNTPISMPASPMKDLTDDIDDVKTPDSIISHVSCLARLEEQRLNFEQQLEQLRAALTQKENMIALFQRENAILEKEKQAFRKEKEMATKEKESTVIKFAMKEKALIDAKKEKEAVERQLAEAKKDAKNATLRFQAVNEEKSRMTYIIDEKCNEVHKYQRECEKWKTDYGHLESKLKYHANKLNMEIENRMSLEKKLEEERNAPSKFEEKANEKLKMEYDANTILLKHEIARKTQAIDNLTQENNRQKEQLKQLQEQLTEMKNEKSRLEADFELLQEEHNSIQNSYSTELLNAAKLRGQLEELQVLKTQNTLNEEKIENLNARIAELEETVQDNATDLNVLHCREQELLSINKNMSESIVELQNEICLLKSKAQAIEAENEILIKEKLLYDSNYDALEKQLKQEAEQKAEERQLLTKHLSEKTKLYEMTKVKLENVLGDFEATKHKHATVVKELQRELQKYKKSMDHTSNHAHTSRKSICQNCQQLIVVNGHNGTVVELNASENPIPGSTHSRNSSISGMSNSRRASETSESETVASSATAVQNEEKGPSKKVLVERILRLQQASARQTEKIDFLENHTLSLVAELQKKSKVVQYYMMRDQTGALTSTKSDQNKSELAKYGNGVMSAIYNGIKGENKSMTLELSLEINRKLQAVLEDTLLKNITLKENLDVLGLEVDNLTRKLRQLEAKK